MAEHPNAELLRKGYEAFANNDLGTLTEMFADDIVWHTPGHNPLSGDYKGREDVFGLFARTAQLSGGTFKIELHDVVANDEHAVALVRSTGSREGKQLDSRESHVMHVSGGKVREFWGFAEDTAAGDAFWS